VPVTFVIGYFYNRKQPTEGDLKKVKPKRPWFILGFIAAAAVVTFFPELRPLGHGVESVAKKLLMLTLFLIGASLSRETLKNVGFRPFLLGISLWGVVASLSLFAIASGWIS
jgi:uncharacterized membrane protein YadS